jgi:hypothetical protein
LLENLPLCGEENWKKKRKKETGIGKEGDDCWHNN